MVDDEHFDAVIVGSGFGGSVMAYRLAAAGWNVCVLERGKAYPPGSFARSPLEMRSNFWDPSEGHHGLFQLWGFEDIDGVVSAGLGGGSLIYANVLLRKDPNWFSQTDSDGNEVPWPVSREDLDPHYDRVERVLMPQKYPLEHSPYDDTPKTVAFRDAATATGLNWFRPDLAVSFADPRVTPGQPQNLDLPIPGEPITDEAGRTRENLHNRTRYTCRLCGECDLGCNYGSKNTLDYNYLTLAERAGAILRTRSEVRTFAPADAFEGYIVTYVRHEPDTEGVSTDTRALPELRISARRLVLAAGTFGTNYLLLKNRQNFPNLSDRLGHGFSGNGDLLGFVHDARQGPANDSPPRSLVPSRGPVITSTVRIPDAADGGPGADGPGLYLQDGGYPGFADWLVEETHLTAFARRLFTTIRNRVVNKVRHRAQTDLDAEAELLLGDARRSSSLLPFLAMGRDTPGHTLRLAQDDALELDWNREASARYFDRATQTIREVADALHADFSPNPISDFHGKVITVHPLGGCAMGLDPSDGVIDSTGQVFGYPGLVIADGSVMPGPVGPNPSLTIAALSDRFADRLLELGL